MKQSVFLLAAAPLFVALSPVAADTVPLPGLDLLDMPSAFRLWQDLLLPQADTNGYDAGGAAFASPSARAAAVRLRVRRRGGTDTGAGGSRLQRAESAGTADGVSASAGVGAPDASQVKSAGGTPAPQAVPDGGGDATDAGLPGTTNVASRVAIPSLPPRALRGASPSRRDGGAEEIQAVTVRTREISGLPDYGADTLLYYDFAEEPSGGYVPDASGSGYDGAIANCVWTNSGRFAGGAMAFGSNDDSINAGYDLDFPSWERYSVSLWFLHDGGGDLGPQYGQKMIDKTSFYHDWHLSIHPVGHADDTGGISLSLYEGGAGGGMGDNSRNYGDGQWHHVAVVRDGANGQFWVDGVLKDTSTNMISVFSYSPLCIGNSYSDDWYQQKGWSGLLDEIHVFGRPLRADEIVALHEVGAMRLTDVRFGTGVAVDGNLSVSGTVSLTGGAYLRPLGDLSCGIYTNGVPPRAD